MEDLPKQAVKEQQKDETALVLGTLLKEGDTLTKSHLADVIYEQFGLPKRFCKEIVDLFFDEALECLVRGEELKLSNFGVFSIKQKSERPGRRSTSLFNRFSSSRFACSRCWIGSSCSGRVTFSGSK